MIVKIYFSVYALGLLAAAAFYLTGNLNPLMQVIFGLLTVTAIFMGVIAVLPFWSSHSLPPED